MFKKGVRNLEFSAEVPFCFVKHTSVEGQELLRPILLECIEIVEQSRYQHFRGNSVATDLMGEKFCQLGLVVRGLVIQRLVYLQALFNRVLRLGQI